MEERTQQEILCENLLGYSSLKQSLTSPARNREDDSATCHHLESRKDHSCKDQVPASSSEALISSHH